MKTTDSQQEAVAFCVIIVLLCAILSRLGGFPPVSFAQVLAVMAILALAALGVGIVALFFYLGTLDLCPAWLRRLSDFKADLVGVGLGIGYCSASAISRPERVTRLRRSLPW